MAALLGLFAGAWAGDFLLGNWGAAIGGIGGFLLGAMFSRRRAAAAARSPEVRSAAPAQRPAPETDLDLAKRVARLEMRVDELERALPSGASVTAAGDGAAALAARVTASDAARSTLETGRPDARSALAPGADGTLQPAAVAAPAPGPATSVATGGTAQDRPDVSGAPDTPRTPAVRPPPNPLHAWLLGGNTLARVGVVLLFIGVGFLLKYAAEHVSVPIALRLAGVALGGAALLVAGWRLRRARRSYAMVLQGGGVGVLYLTVFAALRLYALLPPVAAFLLLLWISALSSGLAVRQNAISLASLAVTGGFLAPILTATEAGNHVLLFGYFALLNAGILGIAWFKAWRSLNLLGFAFTFLVAADWGVTRYRPEFFATTEPFLVLFFFFYLAIAVLYALRRSLALRDYLDGALVFGTPLVAAGLQSALMRDIEYGMAFSALALSAIYLTLARILHRRRDDIRLLVDAFMALGVVFATLAIPLGLDARWTSAAWALEGAAMVWAGCRQQRAAVRGFGLLLQLGAGIAFGLGLAPWAPRWATTAVPVLNSACVGALLVALSGLFSAWMLDREARREGATGANFAPLIFAWGAIWWLAAGWHEIERWVPRDARLSAAVGLLTATAVAFAIAERRLRWPMARIPVLLLLPALLAVASLHIARAGAEHLFAHGGGIAWPLAVAAVAALLFRSDRQGAEAGESAPAALDLWHAGLFWLVLLLGAHELAWLGRRTSFDQGVWAYLPWGLVPALGVAAACALASGKAWPVAAHRRAYLVVGAIPVALLLIAWSIAVNVGADGDPAPLPFVPLANPLDITQALVLVAGATWAARVRRVDAGVSAALTPAAVTAVLAALSFLWINALMLRTIHFAFDVPYTLWALWHSTLVQAALSLLWSTLALATMVFANRRSSRTPWMAGAGLLGIVVAKLFAVELAQAGTIARIVSFIGVGILLLLIGYLAPVPPQRTGSAA